MRPLLAALALILAAGPALAEPTARVVGGNIPVYSGPGRSYAVIGRIPDGTTVPLEYCTRRDSEWCFIPDTGWVLGSYLVGWSGKMAVTPPDFMGPGW